MPSRALTGFPPSATPRSRGRRGATSPSSVETTVPPAGSSGRRPKHSRRTSSRDGKEVTNVLRKLALLVAVAALGLALAGTANAKNHGQPPYGNAYGHGSSFSDGN